MLKVFRDNLKRLAWVLWLVIAVFVLLVFADFNNTRTVANSPDSTAATVAGQAITFGDFQRQYRVVEDRWREIYGQNYTPDLARQLGLPMQAIDGLVSRQILLREAKRMGLESTAGEIRTAILGLEVLKDAQGRFIGYDEYKRLLVANRIEVADFERGIAEQALLEKLSGALAAGAWISDSAVEQAGRLEAETAAIRYLKLNAAGMPETAAASDQELAVYFDAHREDYRLPERRRIGYLSVNSNTVRAELEITPDELREYYQANQAEFTQEEQLRAQHILLFVGPQRTAEQAREQLTAVRERIASGADFATLAGEISEDDATKAQGGDLGFFPRGRMTPQFEAAAFGAAEGELVGPIENQLGPRTGFHLILVNAKRPGGVQPYETVENRIRVTLLNERARTESERRAKDLAERIAKEPAATEEALRAIAARETVPVEILEPAAADDALPGIGRSTPFARAAFAAEVGKLSEPIQIAAGWAIYSALEIQPPRLPELAEVIEQVRADAQLERQNELARAQLTEAKQALAAGKTFEQVAKDLGVELASSAAFRQDGTITGLGLARDVAAAALALETGSVGGPTAVADGLVLFEVTERTHFDPVAFAANREQTRERLRNERVDSLLQSVIEQRKRELEVTYSREFLANFGQDGQLPGT